MLAWSPNALDSKCDRDFVGFLTIASWPGDMSHSWPIFVRDAWAGSRSEIYIPKAPSLCSSSTEHENRVWEELSAPKSLSTAPLSRDNPADEDDGNKDIDHNTKTPISNGLWPQSLPSPQRSISFQNRTLPGRNSANSAELLGEVINLNEEVSSGRTRAQELRQALQHKREEEGDLRLAIRSKLNLSSSENIHGEVATINGAIESLQKVTASYLLLENDYRKFEDELGQKEYALEKRMTKLKKVVGNQSTSPVEQHHAIDYGFDSSPSNSLHGYANKFSSQEAAYLSLVGEARILRRRLTEIEGEYLALMDQQNLCKRIGLLLDKQALGFLGNYEEKKKRIETELNILLRQIQDYPEHAKNSDDAVLEAQWQDVVKDYLPEPPENPVPIDWLHVSEFDDRAPFFEPAGPTGLNKAEFINQWLLHQLRHSKVEILKFKSSPELVDLVDQGWSGDSISQMAFILWFRDETAQMARPESYSAV
ncbi:hypothetical protein N7476_002972 [Penicillium atrosanguineum]|uniref:Uncharacterized protein n=1 Tax=Penicillium atrosanguineum TaxID=1132637 RepID=A0A9W9Q6Y7_9EURO|nr:hypothetical protein N7476_002972 [Penicillium atrosanguineum]